MNDIGFDDVSKTCVAQARNPPSQPAVKTTPAAKPRGAPKALRKVAGGGVPRTFTGAIGDFVTVYRAQPMQQVGWVKQGFRATEVPGTVHLPIGWSAIPEGTVSLDIGNNWLRPGGAALLMIPSVIVHEEFNVLINPEHADAEAITAQKVRPWFYDNRLF